tara:strand:- start:736 stop:963 length:228 start_codon:yes stop_codon:yes gene_type:complete
MKRILASRFFKEYTEALKMYDIFDSWEPEVNEFWIEEFYDEFGAFQGYELFGEIHPADWAEIFDQVMIKQCDIEG